MKETLRSRHSHEQKHGKFFRPALGVLGALALGAAVYFGPGLMNISTGNGQDPETSQSAEHPNHSNVTATVFWVGESESDDNDQIHNRASAWIDDWVGAYGGIDGEDDRCNYKPCAFTPQENPFYFALPYNDLDDSGNQKSSAKNIPWYNPNIAKDQTQLRNYWIKVTSNGKTAYGQWGDVGPFGEEDFDYVFGNAKPQEKRAGLDLSPAMAEYLVIDGRGQADWTFVYAKDVPAGPWKEIVTR